MDTVDESRVEPSMATLPKDWNETEACLRTSDRMRIEGLVHGLRDEGMNVLLTSERAPLVDHYGRLLVRRLRAQSDLMVEVIFPTTTDMLLGRFNQWLSEIPLAQAQAAAAPGAATRVFVVHDAEAVAETELQIMARLAVDFPGLCVRVVLLMNNEGDVSRRRNLLGRRVLQWTVETPEPKELEHLLNQAADGAQREAVTRWLERLGLKDAEDQEPPELDVWVRPSWAVPPPPSESVLDEYEPPQETEIEPPPPASPTLAQRLSRRKTWGLVALMGAVLVLSAVLVVAWYRADGLAGPSGLQSGELKPILPQVEQKD